MKLIGSFRASRGRGGKRNQTRIKSRKQYNESSSFSNYVMKRQNGRGETWTKSRKQYNESSSFSKNLTKRQSFRALRGWGKLNLDKDFKSNNLMKRHSFRALRGGGKGIWIQTRTRYTESSSSLIIQWNLEASALRVGEGGKRNQTRIKSRKQYNESSSFSNDVMKRQNFRASRGRGETWTKSRNGTINRLLSLII